MFRNSLCRFALFASLVGLVTADSSLAADRSSVRSYLSNLRSFNPSSGGQMQTMESVQSAVGSTYTPPSRGGRRIIVTPDGRKIVKRFDLPSKDNGSGVSSSSSKSLRERILQTPQQGTLQTQALPASNGNTGVAGSGVPSTMQRFRMQNRTANGGQLFRKNNSGVAGFNPGDLASGSVDKLNDAIKDAGSAGVGSSLSDARKKDNLPSSPSTPIEVGSSLDDVRKNGGTSLQLPSKLLDPKTPTDPGQGSGGQIPTPPAPTPPAPTPPAPQQQGGGLNFPFPPIIINRPQYPQYPYPSGPVVVTQRVPVETPVVTSASYEAAPQAAPVAEAGSVDLVLENVEFVQPATLIAGPAYRVTFRNQGMAAVGKFRVGLFAQTGEGLSEDAPRAVVEVAGLAADEAGSITMRLPMSAMRMVSASSAQPVQFEQLAIAVDLEDVVKEMDETNNVAQIERAALENSAR